eukprot:TRINITY_DN10640_c0_g1_i6.p3 TRINITY_DN10640_c0_g1~~TRINITY_DN10640_c0_g1_i6.p3  ORF type:complete len:130 (+),score=32.29 TRINITY_DN10640_c0_g1_i6:1260-1649(+)
MIAQSNTIYEYEQVSWTYTPGILVAGVGNKAIGNHIFDAEHQALYCQGNDHTFAGNYIHDVVRNTRDSGAFYMGRDWTYRGNVIENNTFANINTLYYREHGIANDVQARLKCVTSFLSPLLRLDTGCVF